MTKADKIRQMDDAELFKFISVCCGGKLDHCIPEYLRKDETGNPICYSNGITCDDCLEKWLRSEAEENDETDAEKAPEDEKYLIGADALVCISDLSLELFKAMPLFSFLMTCNDEGVMLTAADLASIRGYYEGLKVQNKALHTSVEYGRVLDEKEADDEDV